jgi:hypothetical protein
MSRGQWYDERSRSESLQLEPNCNGSIAVIDSETFHLRPFIEVKTISYSLACIEISRILPTYCNAESRDRPA